MKSLIRCSVIAAFLAGHAAYAQNIAGTWQGTLNAGKELRLVVIVSNANGLAAMVHSIDQGGQGMPASSVTVQGTTVRITLAALGSTFEGQMSADGNSIAGNWSQGGKSLPLTLARATPDTAWKIPPPPTAMAADAPAVFEVATIKPSNPDTPGKLFTVKGRQVMTINTTVADLISFAYGVHAEADRRRAGVGRERQVRRHRTARSSGDAESNAVEGNGAETARRSVRADVSSRLARPAGLRADAGRDGAEALEERQQS